MQQRDNSKRRRKSLSRDGVAVVELAVCLPVLVLILLSTIEACVMLQLQQNVAITAYEGTRIGIMPGATAADVRLQCEMLLQDRSITGYAIAMNPSDLSMLEAGDPLTITVTADCAANAVVGAALFQNKSITESVVMKAE